MRCITLAKAIASVLWASSASADIGLNRTGLADSGRNITNLITPERNITDLTTPGRNMTGMTAKEFGIPTLTLYSREGMNCKGSSYCSPCYTQDISLSIMIDMTNPANVQMPPGVDATRTYRNHEYIFCSWVPDCYSNHFHKSFCLFPQNMPRGNTITLLDAHNLLKKLANHGCQNCGSIPIAQLHGSNDPLTEGILTYNFISNPHNCKDYCTEHQGAKD